MIQCTYKNEDGTPCSNDATCAVKSPKLQIELPACDEHADGKQRVEPINGEPA